MYRHRFLIALFAITGSLAACVTERPVPSATLVVPNATERPVPSATLVVPNATERPVPSDTVALPVVSGATDPCADLVLDDAKLMGDPADPRVVWLNDSGRRQDVVFALGFRARFNPKLEVLDANGQVVAREGDLIPFGCVQQGPERSPLLILPP